MALKPRLTVILPATLGPTATRAALEAWSRLRSGESLQVLATVPGRFMPADPEALNLAPWVRFVDIGSTNPQEARSIAAREILGEYVFFAEDHCLPDEGWAEAMLRDIADGWDVINAAFRPGNRGSLGSLGAFLLGYGEWMVPIAAGRIRISCGHNMCVRTDLLKRLCADDFGRLEYGIPLAWKIRASGARIHLCSEACMRHFDSTTWRKCAAEFTHVGLACGVWRTAHWPRLARWAYPLALPAIAALHFKRAIAQYLRAGRECGIPCEALLASACWALIWATSEAAGCFGTGRQAADWIARAEIKPASLAMVEVSDAWEKRTGFRDLQRNRSAVRG
jgi:hypothetical protein